MMKKAILSFLIVLLISTSVSAQSYYPVEIFSIKEGRVIKALPSNPVIQAEAEKYLKEISGIYVKVKAIPENGYAVRIPLIPSVRVKNEWLDTTASDVILLFPDLEKPYLMVFDQENKPLFFHFEGDTDALLKELGFGQQFTQI